MVNGGHNHYNDILQSQYQDILKKNPASLSSPKTSAQLFTIWSKSQEGPVQYPNRSSSQHCCALSAQSVLCCRGQWIIYSRRKGTSLIVMISEIENQITHFNIFWHNHSPCVQHVSFFYDRIKSSDLAKVSKILPLRLFISSLLNLVFLCVLSFHVIKLKAKEVFKKNTHLFPPVSVHHNWTFRRVKQALTLGDVGPARSGPCGHSTQTPGEASAYVGKPRSGSPGWRVSVAACTQNTEKIDIRKKKNTS